MIGSIIKYFRFSWHYCLWEIDYTNLMMLVATIPVYSPKADNEEEEKEIPVESDMTIEDFINNINNAE